MIRTCNDRDFDHIWTIINDGARAYRGVIPQDCWHEPYMSHQELRREIEDGVRFSGYEERGDLLGVMGLQQIKDVTLIRHAYVRTSNQKQGIGSRLLSHFQKSTQSPVLIGTWAEAAWAIRFYEKHDFKLVGSREKDLLISRYWRIPERQKEVSVVLADQNWFELNGGQ